VQLDYTVVRAPFSGIVRGKPLDEGELLGTFNEKPAVDLYDPETLLAEIDVPEKRLEKIRTDGPAEIVLEAYPESRWRAAVVEVGAGVDRSKGTVVAKLRFIDRPPRLLPDMRARANFLTEELDAAAAKAPPKVVVPKSAIAERGGAKVVFRVEEGRARMVPVTLGPEFGGGYELRAGPSPGTELVEDPPETLADGQPVKEKAR
jgi:RND family efflux transporter MFP subunit